MNNTGFHNASQSASRIGVSADRTTETTNKKSFRSVFNVNFRHRQHNGSKAIKKDSQRNLAHSRHACATVHRAARCLASHEQTAAAQNEANRRAAVRKLARLHVANRDQVQKANTFNGARN